MLESKLNLISSFKLFYFYTPLKKKKNLEIILHYPRVKSGMRKLKSYFKKKLNFTLQNFKELFRKYR